MCSKVALDIKLVFGCFSVFDIANTGIHTWKECKNNKEWGKSRFDEILKLWTFSWDNFVALAFCKFQRAKVRFCLLWGNKGLTKKLEEKTVDSHYLYVFWFGFYTKQNVNSSPITQTGVTYTVQCSNYSENTNCTLKFAFYTSEPHFNVSLVLIVTTTFSVQKMIFKLFTFFSTFMLQHVTK